MKFEELRTENSKLKSDKNDFQRKIESLSNEILNHEEQNRQLQWRLNDERNNQQKGYNFILLYNNSSCCGIITFFLLIY